MVAGVGAVSTIGAIGATGATGAAGVAGSSSAAGRSNDFASLLGNGLNNLAGLDQSAQTQAIKAATGDLTDIQDYVIAATKAQTATELTTAIRNRALDSFNEIMRMPL
jgi:flagellar hook-basal body complex protein FliE